MNQEGCFITYFDLANEVKEMARGNTRTSVDGFPNATIHEENGEIRVDLGNGLGEGVYPSTDYTIEEAINDQLKLFNNY